MARGASSATFAGASQFALLAVVFLFGIGSAAAGEPLFKVWSQELIPTLLRSTSQGLTIAAARIVAAVLALVVPTLLAVSPTAVFVGIFVFAVVAAGIRFLWVPRLPKAADLEKPVFAVADSPEAAERS